MSEEKYDLPESFCVAPWIHAHVGANGNRRLCCIADEAPAEYAKLKYSDFKNSEYMKSIRKSMLTGVTLKECRNCNIVNRSNSYRDDLNREYSHKIENILQSTDENGFSHAKLNYIDYRSNLCNLKCRTCNPGSSSSYQKHINMQNHKIGKILFPSTAGGDEKAVLQFFTQNYASEMFQIIDDNEIDRVYFAGGEPVIEPSHIAFLNKLISAGISHKMSLLYNTNLSFHEKHFENWTSVLKNFTDVKVFVSIDGHDKVCEYIREGVNFVTLSNNIMKLKSNFDFEVILDITLTSLNLFFLKEFAEYALMQNLKVVSKLMFFDNSSFPLLQTESIPLEQKKRLIDRWDQFYSNLSQDAQALLLNLHQTIRLFEEKSQDLSYSIPDYLNRLELFESMYPNKGKFLDLLKEDAIGLRWARILSNEKDI